MKERLLLRKPINTIIEKNDKKVFIYNRKQFKVMYEIMYSFKKGEFDKLSDVLKEVTKQERIKKINKLNNVRLIEDRKEKINKINDNKNR